MNFDSVLLEALRQSSDEFGFVLFDPRSAVAERQAAFVAAAKAGRLDQLEGPGLVITIHPPRDGGTAAPDAPPVVRDAAEPASIDSTPPVHPHHTLATVQFAHSYSMAQSARGWYELTHSALPAVAEMGPVDF